MTKYEYSDVNRVEARVSKMGQVARRDTERADVKAQILLAVIGVALVAGMPGLLRGGLGWVTELSGWSAVVFALASVFGLLVVVMPRPGPASTLSADDLIKRATWQLECPEEFLQEQAEQAAIVRRLASLKWRLLESVTRCMVFAGLLAGVSVVAAALGA